MKVIDEMAQTLKTFSESSKVASVVPRLKLTPEEINNPFNLGVK